MTSDSYVETQDLVPANDESSRRDMAVAMLSKWPQNSGGPSSFFWRCHRLPGTKTTAEPLVADPRAHMPSLSPTPLSSSSVPVPLNPSPKTVPATRHTSYFLHEGDTTIRVCHFF